MDSEAIAEDFVRARLGAQTLPNFPGTIPDTLNAAYAYQDRAIALWPDHLAGWKVGGIGPPWLERVGEDRLVGPIFRRGIRLAPPGARVDFPVFAGGYAAIEAEFVARLGADADPDKVQWSPEEARELVSGLHVGIEAAGSPLAAINDLGPTVVVADFGNNAGLLLGPAITDWRTRRLESLTCETFIEEERVGGGGAGDWIKTYEGKRVRDPAHLAELSAQTREEDHLVHIMVVRDKKQVRVPAPGGPLDVELY
jgi:2-keto-4-pentenoate hydratase